MTLQIVGKRPSLLEKESRMRFSSTSQIEDYISHDQLWDPEGTNDDNPQSWRMWKKLSNVVVITMMSILNSLAYSMFTPGIKEISEAFDTDDKAIIACQSGFVFMLNIGPLVLAPLSESFGRRPLYLICSSIFTLLQIATALAPNIGTLFAMRTITGFFASVTIANGGGTISDLYHQSKRAHIFGIYLLGVLLGPCLGPVLGDIILSRLNWQWISWILCSFSLVNTLLAYIFLRETYTPTLLALKQKLERSEVERYYYYDNQDEDNQSFSRKLVHSIHSIQRPMKILLTQPIVIIIASYQALIFTITYSLYTQMQSIYGEGYGFTTLQVHLLYLFPGAGFLVAVWLLVPHIDTTTNIANAFAIRFSGKTIPESRVFLASLASILLSLCIFWFAWTVQYHVHWAITVSNAFFYGIGLAVIFNCVQNYYVDVFEKYAASAIAAGFFFAYLVRGTVLVPRLFENLDIGWRMFVFAFINLLLAPGHILFFGFGDRLRIRFAVKL